MNLSLDTTGGIRILIPISLPIAVPVPLPVSLFHALLNSLFHDHKLNLSDVGNPLKEIVIVLLFHACSMKGLTNQLIQMFPFASKRGGA